MQPLPDGLLASVDYLIPNESEAASLTGLPATTTDEVTLAARQLRDAGARNVVITLGNRGSLVHTADGRSVEIPAVCPGPAVDTTGAGAAFCGAFAAMLAEGRPVLEAARFASAAAGISVTRHGTARSMPQRREVELIVRT